MTNQGLIYIVPKRSSHHFPEKLHEKVDNISATTTKLKCQFSLILGKKLYFLMKKPQSKTTYKFMLFTK